MVTFGSLFAGIGGFDRGFERAGMVCKWQVEIDDYANKVLAKHWPDVPKYRDICEFPPEVSPWLRHAHRVDVICGGFPCQDISYAGAGAGLEGERSGLFFEAVRVVRELRPRVVVLENVAALLTRGLDRVIGTLAEIGFDAEWHCIPAAAVGAPHIRDRAFVLGFADCCRGAAGQQTSEAARHRCPIGSAGGDAGAVADADGERLERQRPNDGPQGREETRRPAGLCDGAGIRRNADWWQSEPDVGRVAHGVPARVDRLRGLGNAVVPQVAEFVGRYVVEALENNDETGDRKTERPETVQALQ